ncbi:copper amine oxidase N-terminal domain-containing protein [Rummeliibacillus suwonensis]|uniref:copper amine oxidase N-terminal domain-containing protein n=1 Tax=Rummeliibacillus suwonensis TaxID=1306154 RepID=UPI00289A2A81|nr:copper amine oxidase N-terminal domain-containing protein [Rummeliibacillus suwonensis]
MGKTTRWITTGIIGGTIVVTSIQLGNLFDLQQADQETASIANQPKITMVSKAKITNFKTTYNGKAIATKNKAISVGGKYLVPANEVLKKAGATVSYNSKTKTLTIKAGSKTTTHKRGTNYAYINKKKTSLSTKSMVHKGVTMVPYDLVSKATTAKVTVSSATKTIKITKPATKYENVNGIKVKWQGHTYGSDNQTQYDKSVNKVINYINSHSKEYTFGQKYHDAYIAYFRDGKKAPKNLDQDSSFYEYMLAGAEHWGGQLRDNGVPYSTIQRADEASYWTMQLAQDNQYTTVKKGRDAYSAYHILFEKKGDCDAAAHFIQLVFDKFGFQTRVVYGTNHEEVNIKIGNNWYEYISDSFHEVK